MDSSIPENYRDEPRALLARATQALRDAAAGTASPERFGALLMGPTGAGKSSVAAWLLRRWEAHARQQVPSGNGRDPRVAWLDALDATDGERRYRLGSGDPEDLERSYRADWLVLDDVGKSCSPTLLQQILARRYASQRPTIVTTGLTPDELTAHIGAATVRRIVEFKGQPGLLVNAHRPTAGR